MKIIKVDISKNEYKPMKEMPTHTLLISHCGNLAIRNDSEVVFLYEKVTFAPISHCSDMYKIFDGEVIIKN